MKNNNQYFGHHCTLDSLALAGVTRGGLAV